MKNNKNTIRETIEYNISVYELFDGKGLLEAYGYLNSMIDYWKNKHSPKYFNFRFMVESGFDTSYLNIIGDRFETEKEYSKRKALEKKQAAKKKVSLEKRKEKIIEEARRLGLKIEAAS